MKDLVVSTLRREGPADSAYCGWRVSDGEEGYEGRAVDMTAGERFEVEY